MADPSATPYQQEVFAQLQLEKFYETLCKQLWPYRLVVSIIQNALMFRRSHVLYSLAIFVFVHAAFVWYVRTNTGFIGILANILFLYFILDLLWYGSSYSQRKYGGKTFSTEKVPSRFTPLEVIICKVDEPRDGSVIYTYEEVCCLFAKRWNWFNILWMALRHWNRQDPLVFSCIIGTFGLVLILIGWYIPGVVLSYCVVMTILLWPYIEHHQLHYKMLEYSANSIARLINKAVRWVTQMKEYAEDDTDIGTEVAVLDDGFENDLGSRRRASRASRLSHLSDSVMDSFFGPTPVHAGIDPLQSLIDPSLSNVDLNMSLMPPIREHDEDATINDTPSLSEDFGNYDSHDENDDAFPELDFSQQQFGAPVIHQPSNMAASTGLINTSTPVDYRGLPERQEYPLPTYDEVMDMGSNTNMPASYGRSTQQYPDESQVTYRHKNTS